METTDSGSSGTELDQEYYQYRNDDPESEGYKKYLEYKEYQDYSY